LVDIEAKRESEGVCVTVGVNTVSGAWAKPRTAGQKRSEILAYFEAVFVEGAVVPRPDFGREFAGGEVILEEIDGH